MNKKLIIALSVGTLLLVVIGVLAFEQWSTPSGKARQVRIGPTPPEGATGATTVPVEWQAKFNEVYGLADGQDIKFVPRPFIPERLGFYRQESGESQFNSIPKGPDLFVIKLEEGGALKEHSAMFGGQGDVITAIELVLSLNQFELQVPAGLSSRPVAGDWVFRESVTGDKRREAFLAELTKVAHTRPLKMEKLPLEREAVVVKGKLDLHPAATAPTQQGERPVVLYRGKLQSSRQWANHGMQEMFNDLARWFNRPVVVEAEIPADDRTPFQADNSAYPRGRRDSPQWLAQMDEVLANVSKQTGLTFTRENRKVPTWVLSEQPAPK